MIPANIERRRLAAAPLPMLVPLLFIAVFAFATPAVSQVGKLKGQTVYIPAYSHIYIGDKETPFYLTVTLSVRNTDPDHPVTLTGVDYFDSEGKPISSYLKDKTTLAPLASAYFTVKESDKRGGAGASFLVKWQSDAPVTEPLMETVMIGASTQQGISFTSRGRAIKENP